MVWHTSDESDGAAGFPDRQIELNSHRHLAPDGQFASFRGNDFQIGHLDAVAALEFAQGARGVGRVGLGVETDQIVGLLPGPVGAHFGRAIPAKSSLRVAGPKAITRPSVAPWMHSGGG